MCFQVFTYSDYLNTVCPITAIIQKPIFLSLVFEQSIQVLNWFSNGLGLFEQRRLVLMNKEGWYTSKRYFFEQASNI
jgi:hypothetical protein